MRLSRIASMTAAVKPALAHEVVSDYATYSQWIPGLSSSRLLAQEGNFAIVELEFEANPGKVLTVECMHAPTSMVVVRSLTGNKPSIRIDWAIAPTESGDSQITLKMRSPIAPRFLVDGYKSFFNPRRVLAGLRGVLSTMGEGPAGEKVIEIVETEEGLYCTYQGRRYRMEATS